MLTLCKASTIFYYGGPRGRVVKVANMLLIARHLTSVGSSLARVTYETSQGLLRVIRCFFPFSPHLTIDSAQMSEIILTGRQVQINK